MYNPVRHQIHVTFTAGEHEVILNLKYKYFDTILVVLTACVANIDLAEGSTVSGGNMPLTVTYSVDG